MMLKRLPCIRIVPQEEPSRRKEHGTHWGQKIALIAIPILLEVRPLAYASSEEASPNVL